MDMRAGISLAGRWRRGIGSRRVWGPAARGAYYRVATTTP